MNFAGSFGRVSYWLGVNHLGKCMYALDLPGSSKLEMREAGTARVLWYLTGMHDPLLPV